MNPFYESYRVLERVYRDGAHLKIALSDVPEGERARAAKLSYGVLEHDAYLSLCIKTFAKRAPKPAVGIILKIALFDLIFLRRPRHLVTDLAVELTKRVGKAGAGGFVNAFLRSFDEGKVTLPAGDEGLSVESNFPLFAVRLLTEEYGDRVKDIVMAKSGGVSVRFERGMENYLSREHADTPFGEVKLFKNFARDGGFDRGDYTFQSVGSVAVCAAVESCETFLDACAAPGGKSVLLAKRCKFITACELHPHRVELIKSYASRMGAENVAVLQKDATRFDPAWEGAFDGVLCDVPCSGLGTVAENPDLALNKKEGDLLELCRLQRSILFNCARYVKKGGALYYSTCSVLPQENDGVVRAFLSENGSFEVEEVTSPLAHEKTPFGLRFLPDKAFGAGFFVSKMRRKA